MKDYLKNKFGLTNKGASGLVKSSIASFIVFLVNMTPVILLMYIYTELLNGETHDKWSYIIAGGIILIVMAIMLTVEYKLQYNETYKEAANLRIELAEKLAALPLSYFAKHDLSDLAQAIIKDVTSIEHALGHALSKAVAMTFFLPLMLILMLSGNWKMALAATVPSICSYLIQIFSNKYQEKLNQIYYDRLRKNSELFQETIELSREINAFNLRKETKEKLDKALEKSEKLHWNTEVMPAIINMVGNLLSTLSLPITIFVGIRLLNRGEINLLYLVGYVLASMKIKDAIDGSSMFLQEIYHLRPSIERIKEIIGYQPKTFKNYEFKNYDIDVENLKFAYKDDNNVIDGLSFTAKQGEVTALVGPSGCGKTSVLRLISKLYDYDDGKIKIGDKSIDEISPENLYKYISIVFQDVTLFNNSILENIRIGRKDATDEEVKKAAELANCDFILKQKDGFETFIGENGQELSGGERQRISIARAFLKDAPILILDEIASSLDVDNENKIQESLNKLIKNKTVIIISHRIKSIENVDKIVVIKDGKLSGEGTHENLLKTSDVYKNLIEKTKQAEDFIY